MLKNEKIEKIFKEDNIIDSINERLEMILDEIPEIKSMIGFEHRHPHHHLDVWKHTLQVVENLDTDDLELNMAGLLHDIGKPFSYQDDLKDSKVRHFHGHPEVSYEMSKAILERLGCEEKTKNNVLYLVKTHDTIIDTNKLDNTFEMVQKRLKLQFADARAHHPDKVEKRIKFLDEIKNELKNLEYTER